MIILNPKGINRFSEQRKEISPRLSQLQGKTIAFLNNLRGKAYFDRIEQLLKGQAQAARIIWFYKPNYPAPAPPEVLDRIASECDAAIVGTGT